MSENRFIIGGYSPEINKLSPEVLSTGRVIGINLWGKDRPCDFWIALDTFRWHEWKGWIQNLDAVRAMRSPNKADPREESIPADAADLWFDQSEGGKIPTHWEGRLRFESSTAMAAISLAIVMGATEIILYGVDFMGQGRADGSEYRFPDFWDRHQEPINKLMADFQQHATIYKTNAYSWLNCPYMEV